MSSNHMEKEGLSRALQFLINQHHLNIAQIGISKCLNFFAINIQKSNISMTYGIFQKIHWSSKL